ERSELEDIGVMKVDSYKEFAEKTNPPRVIYLSLPAGDTIDNVIEELKSHLEQGDVIMDGGNSFFRDSLRRYEDLSNEGIEFVDCGTSGGVAGARNGACFMVGGEKQAVNKVEPVLRELSVKGGFLHVGGPGSGHFVKLVHNGIEFGMLQAIGEGVELLKASEFDLDREDLADIFHNWSNGSVIRSWLVELMEKGLRSEETPDFEDIENYIEDTGEVNWLVQEAIKNEVPTPVIAQSVIELFKSRGEQKEAYKAIALMRHGFGGHPFGKDEYIEKEREESRIEKI
ncbi:MAG: decarboxylating 6-phosphogluconate dehydrogenase, partial [Hadesarchaea archaeon]|nr:decarboxylating 6-phosphogluconate dehydrogenase [Hadesarchaea archaeon]